MNPQTQKEIAELEAKIAGLKAGAVVTDLEHGIKAYVQNQSNQKSKAFTDARDALYRACKGFTNAEEKRRKNEATPETPNTK